MWLLLLVLLWLGLEVASIVYAADLLGSGWMALWATLVTSIIGITVLGRAQQALNPAALMRSTIQGGNPIKAVLRALVPAIAGILMILPGFAGDCVALLLLFPLTRPFVMLLFGGLLLFGIKRLAAKGSLRGAAFMQGMDLGSFGGANSTGGPNPSAHMHHAPRRGGREEIVDAKFDIVDTPKRNP